MFDLEFYSDQYDDLLELDAERRARLCPTCGGSGVVFQGWRDVACPVCHGHGFTPTAVVQDRVPVTAPEAA